VQWSIIRYRVCLFSRTSIKHANCYTKVTQCELGFNIRAYVYLCRRLEPSPHSRITPTSPCVQCLVTSSAASHVTTRKQVSAAATEGVEGAGRAWMVGGGLAAGLVLLLAVALAVYRYRRCYEGSYDVDAELPMNGYVPSGTCSDKRNGSVKSMSHCTVSRSSRELYV